MIPSFIRQTWHLTGKCRLAIQDAAGLPAASNGEYKYSVADTFLLRGTVERVEKYNRYMHKFKHCRESGQIQQVHAQMHAQLHAHVGLQLAV